MQSPKETLNKLSLGDPKSLNGLTVIPIFRTGGNGSALTDIDKAIEKGWLEVTEVSETGHVPELGVVNHSDKTVIAFDGEECGIGRRDSLRRSQGAGLLDIFPGRTRPPDRVSEGGATRAISERGALLG